MKKLIILGGGGFASEIAETIEQINQASGSVGDVFQIVGFVYDGAENDKDTENWQESLYHLRILGEFDILESMDLFDVDFVCAVSTPEIKKKLVKKIKSLGGKFATLIHPKTILSPKTVMGEGCIIQSNCILTGYGIVLGDFVTLNDNVAIGHRAKVGSFTHINPNTNVSGEAEIGEDVFVGVKATILKAKIGNGAVIGACALVTKDVPDNLMAKGIPAVLFEKSSKRYRDNDVKNV